VFPPTWQPQTGGGGDHKIKARQCCEAEASNVSVEYIFVGKAVSEKASGRRQQSSFEDVWCQINSWGQKAKNGFPQSLLSFKHQNISL